MSRKKLQFCLLAIAIVYFFRKIPLEWLFQAGTLQPFAGQIAKFILNIVVILGCYLVASKKGLLELGGFVQPVMKNYWMIFLPILFPGILLYRGSENNCSVSFVFILVSAGLAFSGALMEEILFRGLIQGYLRKKNAGNSDHPVVIYTSLFFALVHFANLQQIHLISVLPQVVYAFYMGLLFSALLYRTNNVWLLGIVHGLLNLFSQKCGQPTTVDIVTNPSAFGFSDYLLQMFGFILILSPVLLVYWILMKTRPEN